MPTLDDLQAAVTAAQDKPGADKIQAAWKRVQAAIAHLETTLADTAAKNEANERKTALREQAAALEAQLAAVKAEMRPAKKDTAAAPEVDADAVRAWAASQDIKVSKRGRLAGHVIDQYRDAHELVPA